MTASRPTEPAHPQRLAASARGGGVSRPRSGEREVSRRNTYALRIRGHRMQPYNLFDGDVIVLHRHQQSGYLDTATATINRCKIALKELSISRLGVRFCPEGEATVSVFLHNSDIQVLGMVMGVGSPAGVARRH